MLSKIKIFRLFSHLGSSTTPIHKGNNPLLNKLHYLSLNRFCTITRSPTTAESPELPEWLKFSQNNNPTGSDSDDDFVIPELAHWVENQKHDHGSKVEGHTLKETIDSDIDKISKLLKFRHASVDDFVHALGGCGVCVSESLVEQVLKRFSNDWIPAFGYFKWAKSQTAYRHSANSYDSMVDVLGKLKKFDLMWQLVEEMHGLGGYVTLATMTKVMRRLARASRWEDAIEAFRGMERFGVRKDTLAMNTLMDALVKENSVERATDVFLEFKDSIPLNSRTFNILIHGWCKARKMNNALKSMEEMKQHGFCPDAISYTSIVEAHCNEKDFRKADSVLSEMEENGYPPNVVTYTIVMHALGKGKEISKALEVYERMKQRGCVPDAAFYSSLIYILSKAGRLKDARDVFDDMTKQGAVPDVLTYNTMISAACKHSQEEDALKLLVKMDENSCKPDLNTYSPLLKMCCRNKRMKVLSALLNHMFKNDISLEVGTYTLLVHGLCKSEKLEWACLFFEEMVSKGLVPNDSTHKLLLIELEKKSMVEAKERVEKLMSQARQQG